MERNLFAVFLKEMKNTKQLIYFFNKHQSTHNLNSLVEAINLAISIKNNHSKKLQKSVSKFISSYDKPREANDRQSEINNSARIFCESIGIKASKISTLSDQNNKRLWKAYSIYDKILDSGSGNKKLGLANLNLINYCQNILIIKKEIRKIDQVGANLFYNTSFDILNKMEEANISETNLNKVLSPSLLSAETLSQKSLGQAIPSLAIICAHKKEQFKNVILFHQYYLAARQLADDLHDIKEDNTNNIYNPLSLLKKYNYSDELIMDLVAKKIKKYCQKARESLCFIKDEQIFKPINYIEERASNWLNNKELAKQVIIQLKRTKTPS